MIDITAVPELSSTSDSQSGDLLVTGIALVDLADEGAIHQCIVWVGRTSTQPNESDIGVRTRQFGANAQGMAFVLRFRGIRVNPGDILKVKTRPIVETNTAVVHQNVLNVKWTFREMRQG